jgi:hypothetical protein
MKNKTSEFDLARMKVYMAVPAQEKLKYLEEANEFFAKFKNEKTDKIKQELKLRGF